MLRLTGHHDPADFQNIAVVRRLQCDIGVLFDQHHRNALFGVQAFDDRENFLHQQGRQAKAWLVQQHHFGLGHQAAPDR